MTFIDSLCFFLVLTGVVFLALSLRPMRQARTIIPRNFRLRWQALGTLILFFSAGYVLFVALLLSGFHVHLTLLAGTVFAGGAIFVFLVIDLCHQSLQWFHKTDNEVRQLNETLEHRILERTAALEHSSSFLKTVLNSLQDSIAIINVDDYTITCANTSFLREFQLCEEEVIGKTCFAVTHGLTTPCSSPDHDCPLLRTMENGEPASCEHVHPASDSGFPVYVEIHTVPIRNGQGRIRQVVHCARNITDRKKSESRIRHMAYYDPLTGLPNRTYYKKLLDRSLAHARRHNRIMAVLLIDLDAFKRINDTLGHAVGDSILQSVAKRLLAALRSSDCVARTDAMEGTSVSRLGDDEFIVLLNEILTTQDAAVVARRLLLELAAPFFLEDHEVVITASIGIALFPMDGTSADSLFRNADLAMYHAKSQGRNKYQFFTRQMNDIARERLTLENGLRNALKKQQFILHYQPQIRLDSLRVHGLEALIRWQHPDRGLVPPLDFIPLAEQNDLILLIGEWVLRTACLQLKELHAAGFDQLNVAVNLSNRQFAQENLLDVIRDTLRETDLDGCFLEIELTESAFMKDPQQAIFVLQNLQKIGVRIAIDDFGTGYSSFEWLKIRNRSPG